MPSCPLHTPHARHTRHVRHTRHTGCTRCTRCTRHSHHARQEAWDEDELHPLTVSPLERLVEREKEQFTRFWGRAFHLARASRLPVRASLLLAFPASSYQGSYRPAAHLGLAWRVVSLAPLNVSTMRPPCGSHCGHTAVTMRSHCGYTVVTQRLPCGYTAHTLRSHAKVTLRLRHAKVVPLLSVPLFLAIARGVHDCPPAERATASTVGAGTWTRAARWQCLRLNANDDGSVVVNNPNRAFHIVAQAGWYNVTEERRSRTPHKVARE